MLPLMSFVCKSAQTTTPSIQVGAKQEATNNCGSDYHNYPPPGWYEPYTGSTASSGCSVPSTSSGSLLSSSPMTEVPKSIASTPSPFGFKSLSNQPLPNGLKVNGSNGSKKLKVQSGGDPMPSQPTESKEFINPFKLKSVPNYGAIAPREAVTNKQLSINEQKKLLDELETISNILANIEDRLASRIPAEERKKLLNDLKKYKDTFKCIEQILDPSCGGNSSDSDDDLANYPD